MKNSKKEIMLSALLTNPTIREAAEAAGVPEQTLYNWLRKPDFKKEYDTRRRQMVDDAANYLQAKLSEATTVVFEIMNNTATLPQVRLTAARTVFEYACKFIEQQEILARLDALEGMVQDHSKR